MIPAHDDDIIRNSQYSIEANTRMFQRDEHSSNADLMLDLNTRRKLVRNLSNRKTSVKKEIIESKNEKEVRNCLKKFKEVNTKSRERNHKILRRSQMRNSKM